MSAVWRPAVVAGEDSLVGPGEPRDVNDIFEYLGPRSPQGVRSVFARIEARVRSLADNPLIGQAIPGSDARILVVTRTNYVVIYRVDAAAVTVLRVLHGARDRTSLLDDRVALPAGLARS